MTDQVRRNDASDSMRVAGEGHGERELGGSEERIREIPIDLIIVRDSQTRSKVNERAGLEELKANIQAEGFNSAILVRPVDDKFEIIAGHRRFYAAKEAGLTTIPCVITSPLDERARLVRQITENTNRVDYQPVELACAFAQLMEASPGADKKDVAAHVDVHPQRFGELLRLARSPDSVKQEISKMRLSESHAIQIATLYETYRVKGYAETSAIKRTLAFVRRCARHDLSVSVAKTFVAKEKARLGGTRRRRRRVEPQQEASTVAVRVARPVNGVWRWIRPDVPYKKDNELLVLNLRYLTAGQATGDEKAALHRELDAAFELLRKCPTRMLEGKT